MEAVPGWRKPIALVGWAVLIAFLIGVIAWGLNELAQDRATEAPARGALPHMPSVITLPSLPAITLPPGR